MSEVVVIASGKDGIGRTATSANVGTGLAILSKRVMLIDTDIGLRSLDVVVGLENRVVYNLVDVMEGNCRVKQALIRDKRYSDLYLLPSARTGDKTAMNPERMIKLVDDLRGEFGYILLDCPAGIKQGLYNAIAGAGRILMATAPGVSTIRDADRIVGLLEYAGLDEMGLIVSRVRSGMVRRGDMVSPSDVTDILVVSITGTVPGDKNIVVSTNQGEPLVSMDSSTGQAHLDIYRRLSGESVPTTSPGQTEAVFARLCSILRRVQKGWCQGGMVLKVSHPAFRRDS